MSRRRATLAAGLALCVAGVAIALVAALSGGGAAARSTTLDGPLMPAHFRAADFTLHDQDGRRLTLATSRGRVVVMTFLHSLCHSTCPVTAQTIRGALDDIGQARRGVDVFAITVAPREDSRRHVRRFLRMQHVAGWLHYLTGPLRGIHEVWKRYGIHPLTSGEDHTAFVFLIDRRGVMRVGYPSHEMTSEDLAHDLRILLAQRPSA
jgi:protein SCO1/2